jgi:hypothetical protein
MMQNVTAGYATQGFRGTMIFSIGMHRYRIPAKDVAALLASDARVQVYREFLHQSALGFGTIRYQYAGYAYTDPTTHQLVVDLRWPLKSAYFARMEDLNQLTDDPAGRVPLYPIQEGES